MGKGKKIHIYSLLAEIKDDEKIKNDLIEIYDFIYNEKRWSHLKPPRSRVQLYYKIEELLGNQSK